MRAARLSVVTAVVTAAALTAVTGCTEKSKGDGDAAVKVTAADSKCDASAKSVPAGQVTLSIENKGSQGDRGRDPLPGRPDRVGEGEHRAGHQVHAHRGGEGGSVRDRLPPGHEGRTASGRSSRSPAPARSPSATRKLDKAVADYREYAQEQADATLPKVETFAEAIKAGDLDAAKKAYAPSRVGWERTEPIAESFGDIDPRPTPAPTAWRRARSGPAGTRWRRRCGRTRRSAPRRRRSPTSWSPT